MKTLTPIINVYLHHRKSEPVPYFVINLAITGNVYLPITHPSILKITIPCLSQMMSILPMFSYILYPSLSTNIFLLQMIHIMNIYIFFLFGNHRQGENSKINLPISMVPHHTKKKPNLHLYIMIMHLR